MGKWVQIPWEGGQNTVHSKCINDHTLRFDIFLPKCPTNLSQHSLSPTIWSDVRVEIKRFFFTFLEVNMSNICDRCVFVSVLSFRCVECTLVYFLPCTIFAPGKVAPRSIFVTLGHNSRAMHRSTS